MYQVTADDKHQVIELADDQILYNKGIFTIKSDKADKEGLLIIYMTGCPPCIRKAPQIKKLSKLLPTRNFYALEGLINPIGQRLIDVGFPTIRYVDKDGQILLDRTVQIDMSDRKLQVKPIKNQSL